MESTINEITFQSYKFDVKEIDDIMYIYIYGLTIDRKRVCVKVVNFKPFIYLELPGNIKWTNVNIDLVKDQIKKMLKSDPPTEIKLQTKKKIYYFAEAKFLKLSFNSKKTINLLKYLLKKPQQIFGLGQLTFQIHENTDPILQLFAMTKIKPAGWITITQCTDEQVLAEHADKVSNADYEIIGLVQNIKPAIDNSKITNPLIVSYDIECISADASGNTFPNPDLVTDQIICICATVGYIQDEECDWKQYSHVNEAQGKKCPNLDNTVFHYPSERELLLGWSKFIMDINPDVIIGYNSLSFDDKYITKRTEICQCWPKFSKMGRLLNVRATTGERKWSSSAYGEQMFSYIDIPGRLHVDMYPVIFKDFPTLMSYTLDYVSEQFLGEHKVNLPAKEMIKSWHRGTLDEIKDIVIYCNQDTLLPLKLMQKMNSWIGLVEMANVVMVQIFDLVTRGQQIRVFSQVYTVCYDLNVVCTEKWADYKPSDAEKEFVGATVQNPQTGYHEFVITFDFKSLYPTTIIAFNICFSTFVAVGENPPLSQIHVINVPSHQGCEHDHAIRKTKVKKVICKEETYRFYRAEIKKGIVPMLLENLLSARANTNSQKKILEAKIKNGKDMNNLEIKETKLLINVLDKRQNGFKISANSMYGGFGSDYSLTPFYPGAAATTAMGRKKIQEAIDFSKEYRNDFFLVYGDTDSCMIKFTNITDLEECFKIGEDLEHKVNAIFPKPMYLEMEKIYSKYFLLSKKRYVGYIVNKKGEQISVDKKGVVIKRRDNCAYLRDIYNVLIEKVMAKEQQWKIFEFIQQKIDLLLLGRVELKDLIITKSIKENYKTLNLPHLVVSKKMIERGKYVTAGTRIQYIFVITDNANDPQYVKAEDPDYYLANQDTLQIDYMYYLEKQLIKPIDEVLFIKFNKKNILANFYKLYKKNNIKNAKDYFYPQFKIV
jgi:DNA polymerase delta subunit 1